MGLNLQPLPAADTNDWGLPAPSLPSLTKCAIKEVLNTALHPTLKLLEARTIHAAGHHSPSNATASNRAAAAAASCNMALLPLLPTGFTSACITRIWASMPAKCGRGRFLWSLQMHLLAGMGLAARRKPTQRDRQPARPARGRLDTAES